ncbi:ATP-binding protein [Isoptericola hypogeus]|uniref:ATP-binding protein n=1 Tax=Isoptericola hypogeus TaxID=300179 RepID=A0ABP4VGJ6_9MICO
MLAELDAGRSVDGSVEQQVVDLKEEHGRRDKSGRVGPSQAHNEGAAKELAAAAACMANTPGGGALIVGVSDSGEVIGTSLDSEWLRHRMWELSGRSLTVDIAEQECRGHRLLILVAPQAVEPIRVGGKVRWRVGANCVEVDPHTWHAKRMAVLNYDWSAEASMVPVERARPAALRKARDLLFAAGEPHAAELAGQSDTNLLRRLNVVTADGLLTNAGVIGFVGRGEPCIDYVRRLHVGGDSLVRVRRHESSLLEELGEVFSALEASTPTVHVQRGLVIGQQREIPLRAAREAVVNGVAHREWGIQESTLVEQIGSSLRVTSPGGFVGGVTPANIITHPSRSRNRALAELLAALRVAEREGIGVDRMVGDMVRRGQQPPQIEEISGPSVRVTLVGDDIDQPWIGWLGRIQPSQETEDLNTLLILRHIVDQRWIDAFTAAGLIQDTVAVATGALARVGRTMLDGRPVIVRLDGVPDTAEPVWTLSSASRSRLHALDSEISRSRLSPSRESTARAYVLARGRSTELAGLVGADRTNVGTVLKGLEDEGVVRPSWPSRRGKGFHYVRV